VLLFVQGECMGIEWSCFHRTIERTPGAVCLSLKFSSGNFMP
jgi:hypothetical protein